MNVTDLKIFFGTNTGIAKLSIVGFEHAVRFVLTVRLHNRQRVIGLTVSGIVRSTTDMASIHTAVVCVLDINLASAGALDWLLFAFTNTNPLKGIWFFCCASVGYLLMQKWPKKSQYIFVISCCYSIRTTLSQNAHFHFISDIPRSNLNFWK